MRHWPHLAHHDEPGSGFSLPARDTHLNGLEQRSQAIAPFTLISLVVLLIQLWLINIAQVEYMAEGSALAVPTTLASLGCFIVNLWILKEVHDIDRGRE